MIIGIGGVSNAGKSTLARKIRNLFPERKTTILCQDDFVKPHYELPHIGNHIDWELPETIDFQYYYNRILIASRNSDLVIAEGLFAFYNPALNRLYDKKIFITISKETFYKRKKRDVRWGKEPHWYIDHIWESYLKYGTIEEGLDDVLYLSGEKEIDVDKIMHFLNTETIKSL